MSDEAGTEVGKYRLGAKLGEGGMGAVYRAEHTLMGKPVAVKLLRPEAAAIPELATRFLNEARAVARVQHPGIVEVFDCGVDDRGRPYLAMELLRGESLGSFLRRHGSLAAHPTIVRRIGRDTALAVAAAHAVGIVHRDLKPDNLYLCAHHEGPGLIELKVLDFGVAKLAPSVAGLDARTTRSGTLVGTALYMSPEQCKSSKQIDHRTDVYALGCILFELGSGRPPFVEESLGAVIAAHLMETPPRLRDVAPGTAPALDDLVARMLAKDPAGRPADMAAVAAALGEGLPPAVRSGPIVLPPGLLLEGEAPRSAAAASSEPTAASGDGAPPSGGGAWSPIPKTAVMDPETARSFDSPAPSAAPAGRRAAVLAHTTPFPVPPQAPVGGTTLSALATSAPPRPAPARRWMRIGAPIMLGSVALLAAGVAIFRPGTSDPPAGRQHPTPLSPSSSSSPSSSPSSSSSSSSSSSPSSSPAAARADTVRIDVTGIPSGGRALVDGRAAVLPIRLPRGAQEHELRIEAPGYEPFVDRVNAAADQNVAAVLKPLPAASPPSSAPSSPAAGGGSPPTGTATGRRAGPAPPRGSRRGAAPAREGERRAKDLILDI